MPRPPPNKYLLYEAAVQSPDQTVDLFNQVYFDLFKRPARTLREDFCGTFLVCCEWVQSHPRNLAVGVDLCAEPLEYGRRVHLTKLRPGERKRVRLLQQNVLSITSPKADLQVAGNFSFYVFKQRRELLRYCTSARKSLASNGALVLEMVGGPGLTGTHTESKTCEAIGAGRFKYTWERQAFDPVTQGARFAIHFKRSDGQSLRNAFTYDWRVWTVPEVREALLDAGFDRTCVYWYETSADEVVGYRYRQLEKADNDHAWLAYVVGVKGR